MDISFTKTFERELRKITEKKDKENILQAIENVETANKISEINNIKKLKGSTNAYRIRVNDFRLGLYIDNTNAEFHRVKKRKDIYKYFPLFLLP